MLPFYERQERRLLILGIDSTFQFPPHMHNHLELTYCIGGKLGMRIDAQRYILAPGDAALTCPNTVHSYQAADEKPVQGIMILFDPLWISNLGQSWMNVIAETPFISGDVLHPHCVFAFEAILQEYQGQRPDEYACHALLELLLARLVPHIHLVKRTAASPGDLMHRAFAYLAESYAQPCSLGSAAQALGVHPHHLSHAFSRQLGMGYHEYVNALRLNQAEMLLRGTDISVTQICYDCGFESQSTFNRLFRAAHDMTPREYRRLRNA